MERAHNSKSFVEAGLWRIFCSAK